jgi:hypothetical protein
MLTGRSPAAVRQVDAWMARALTVRSGAIADADVRAAAWEALPQRVTAHAALLQSLADSTAGSVTEDLPFVGALAEAAPEAAALATYLRERGLRVHHRRLSGWSQSPFDGSGNRASSSRMLLISPSVASHSQIRSPSGPKVSSGRSSGIGPL